MLAKDAVTIASVFAHAFRVEARDLAGSMSEQTTSLEKARQVPPSSASKWTARVRLTSFLWPGRPISCWNVTGPRPEPRGFGTSVNGVGPLRKRKTKRPWRSARKRVLRAFIRHPWPGAQ
jgi:hypothetical protein